MSKLDPDQQREVEHWRSVPRGVPVRIEPAGPGQESVWEYPRPPRLEEVRQPIRVEFAGQVVADTRRALRVCETASPPTYYLPPDDIDARWLRPAKGSSLCEWKGAARYHSLQVGDRVSERAAWSYPDPLPPFEALRDYLAFFVARVDACSVGDERVRPQPGGFYGGWITSNLVGPFKGEPGTGHW